MGVMNEAIEDGIGVSRIANDFMFARAATEAISAARRINSARIRQMTL